ncbi:glycosyltransferase [Candidatus Pelagibacter ubique]|nr:glycosyltransferase [Candidatus Pelagibacter ubique]
MIKPLIGLINLIKSIILLFKVYPNKFFFFAFVFLTLLASIIEIATIASILPLIDLLIDNNKYLSNKYVNLLVNNFDLKENELKLTYLIIFTVLLIASYLIKISLILVNSYLNHEVAFYIHNKVVKKLLNQNYKYFIDNTTSNFLAIIEKIEAVRGVVFSLLLLLMSLIMSSSIIFLILLIDFKNSIILFVIMGIVYILMYSFTHKRLNDISFLQAKIIDKKYKVFLEFSHNIKEIILRNLNNFFFSKQYEIMISLRNSRISSERYTNIALQTTILIFMLMIVGILFYFTTLKGNLVSNASLIVFYVVAIQRLIPHAQNVYVSLMSGIKNPQYSILNVLDVLNLPDERNIKSDNFEMEKINLNSEISVQNLTFKHNEGLKNIIVLNDAVNLNDFLSKRKVKKNDSIVYIGSFFLGKGLELIYSIAKKRPDFKFDLYGDTTNIILSDYKLKNINFFGHIKYNKIPKILAKYDYAIMPYGKKVNVKSSNLDVSNTMSPLKMFDYLASSQVILATDTNVYKHILKNNYNSILIKHDKINKWIEAIDVVKKNKPLKKKLKNNAFKTAKKYTWDSRLELIEKRFF